MLLPFQLYGANFNLFMSHLNLILNHLMRMKNSVHYISFGNVIASVVVRAVSYLHSRDIANRDIKPGNILVFSSHHKSFKHEELKMAFGKNLLSVNLVIWGKRYLCIHRLPL